MLFYLDMNVAIELPYPGYKRKGSNGISSDFAKRSRPSYTLVLFLFWCPHLGLLLVAGALEVPKG